MQHSTQIEQHLAELEMKMAFQEKTIEELNQALIQQQFTIDKIKLQLHYLVNKLKDVQSSNIATQAEETSPPHY